MNWNNYWRELKRRNVIKSALAYLVVAWMITQVLSIILPAFDAPPFLLKMALIVLLIGFPLWIIFSWIYEFTADGIKKTADVDPKNSLATKTGSKINKIIVFALSLTIIILIVERITNKPAKILDYGDKSIAVLAFADMSPNKDHEYFSDGISEELLNILVGISDLKVISRTSSFSYKNKNVTATKIGEELNVSHILEGSIRKAGNMVRITAQLINTNDGSHVWSQTYDRNLDSIFKIQDDIAQEVSDQLQLTLLGKSDAIKPPQTEAYNLYLQAKYIIRQNTKESYVLAEDIINQSIAIDSTYANAWDLLASIHSTGTYNFNIGDRQQKLALGLKAAKKAIALDPNSAEPFVTLASLQEQVWNFEDSAKNMDKALQLKPNDAIILGTVALYTYGDLEKSVDLLKTAIDLDPLVHTNYFNLGFAYYRLHRFDEATEAFNKFAIYYPNAQILSYMKAQVHLAQGEIQEAKDNIEKETHEFFSLYGKNFVYYDQDNTKVTDSLFNAFLAKYSTTEPANTADLFAFRGDYATAFEYLNKALEIKDPVLLEALTYPSFEQMKTDMRWTALLDKINLPDNHDYHE